MGSAGWANTCGRVTFGGAEVGCEGLGWGVLRRFWGQNGCRAGWRGGGCFTWNMGLEGSKWGSMHQKTGLECETGGRLDVDT